MSPVRHARRRLLLAVLLSAGIAPSAFALDVRICTSQGIVELELDERNAPRHTRNFARYAESGFYSGTVIHRAVEGTMVQGGGYDRSLERRLPGAPVASEAGNGLANVRGTIAASRMGDADSATSQFFINLADNSYLDEDPEGAGFTVFGRVTAGLDVLDAISRLPTRPVGDFDEVPVPLVELESVSVLERGALFGLAAEADPAALAAALDAARARGDAAQTLAAVTDLRRACASLTTAQLLAEAEAAQATGETGRARYSLEQLLARTPALDPLLPRAQRLYASLPAAVMVDISQRLASCDRPAPPTVPDGSFTALATLQTIEGEIRRYRQLGETWLICVTAIIDDGTLTELEAAAATEEYNAVVIELTATVTRFNEAAAALRAGQ